MNRQIIFRGKCLDNGEWIYGDLQLGDGDHIPMIGVVRGGHDPDYYQVEEETIGQFTGLRDKDSRPIYEGDIVMQRGYSGVKPMVVRFEQGAFIVGWHGGSSTQTRPMLIQKRCEVIGNAIDHPDLLNGKEND